MTAALTRPRLLSLTAFSRAAGMHPDLVMRFVALGLLDPVRDAAGEPCFPPAQLAAASRLQRLRAGLALNYAALGVVVDLLNRVAELEARLRNHPRPDGGPSWT